MEFLSRALDDPAAAPCGKCMNCTGKTQRQQAPAQLIQEAVNFLRGDTLVLEPRFRWPKPLLKQMEKVLPQALDRFDNGRPKVLIPESLQAQEGRVLCIYGDSGWGQEVADGKYKTGRFNEALLKAAAELIEECWKPEPAPIWVTCIPSERHPELVQDFGRRLAAHLNVPFAAALRKRRTSALQKEMQNSVQQLRNVLEAFQVVNVSLQPAAAKPPAGVLERFRSLADTLAGKPPVLPSGPVLLVDDMVDSGWTLTIAAVLLRLHGSGPVYPFALAKASPRGG